MTKKRQMIIDLLNNSKVPLNASQIYINMDKVLDMATVYRALKYLELKCELTSFVFDCEERGVERYYSKTRSHHEHYMHCSNCHCFIPIKKCPVGDAFELIEHDTGFKVEHHTLTLKGLCRKCRN